MLCTLLLLLAPQNLVVNGDFENNSSAGCDYNNPNATFNTKMAACTAFGGRDEIDIMDGGCYGPNGPAGTTKIGLACNGDPLVDALTMDLTGNLQAGQTYQLKIWLYGHIESWSPQAMPIAIGVAAASGTMGTQVASLTPSTSAFTQHVVTFVAPNNGGYLSLAATTNYDGWTHVDGVELTGGFSLAKSGSCPGPVTLTTSGGTSGGLVALAYGLAGSYTKPGGVCAGTTVAISQPTIGAVLTSNGSGTASMSVNAKASWCGLTVQAVDLATCTASNAIVL